MSNKWFDDEELKSILGQSDEEEGMSSISEDLLADLIADETPKKKVPVTSSGASEEDGDGIFYDEPNTEVEVKRYSLEELSGDSSGEGNSINFQTLHDLPLEIRVLLGSTEMTIEEILNLEVDSVVKLPKMAGEPVDIVIGDQIIAKGETVVLDDRFGVIISEIIPPRERIKVVEKKLRG